MENSSEIFPLALCTVMLPHRGTSNEDYKQRSMLSRMHQISLRDLVSFATLDPLTSPMNTTPP